LTVAVANSIGGSVSSSTNASPPPSIAGCTTSCAASYNLGSSAPVTQSIGTGYTSGHWGLFTLTNVTSSGHDLALQISGNPIVNSLVGRQVQFRTGPTAGQTFLISASSHTTSTTSMTVSNSGGPPPAVGDQFTIDDCRQFYPGVADCGLTFSMNDDQS